MVLRLGGHLVAAGHLAHGDAMFGLVVLRHQLIEERLHALAGLVESRGYLSQRERLLGDIHDGLQQSPQLRAFRRNRARRLHPSQQIVGSDGLDRFASLRVGIALYIVALRDRRVGITLYSVPQRTFQLQLFHHYRYSLSIAIAGSAAANTASNIRCLRRTISPNKSVCPTNTACCFTTSSTACCFTTSSTARNSVIIAFRLRCSAKTRMMYTGSSPASRNSDFRRRIICATLTSSSDTS